MAKLEYEEMVFSVRKTDRKKMIQSFLAMTVNNLEQAAVENLSVISESILNENAERAKDALEGYIEYANEYSEHLSQILDLIVEHMFVETKQAKLKFKSGEKIKMSDLNEKISEKMKEDSEKKQKMKEDIKKRRTAKKAKATNAKTKTQEE